MKPVGYLLNHPEGLDGERGIYFNYILAANGLFIEAENKLLSARIPINDCEVRGLAPVQTKIVLTYGSIPQRFFDLALDFFLSDISREQYVAVTGDAGYHFYVPIQDREGGQVVYEFGDSVVLDIHSHGCMGAWFSTKDNEDEKGLKLYGVVGKLGATPVVKLRVGVYGYFQPLSWCDIFDGQLNGVLEYEKEEVLTADELQGIADDPADGIQHHGGWLRWDRLLRR